MQQYQQYLGDVIQGLSEFDELDFKDVFFLGEFFNMYIFVIVIRIKLIVGIYLL